MGQPEDLIDDTMRIVRETGPRWVFLECVPGFMREHQRVRTALDEIGYSLAPPIILDASRVGAPVARPRYWALARSYAQGEPVVPIHAEMACLPAPDCGPWETDPTQPAMAHGVADGWEMACAGDGQIPLQAAVAWKILGGGA
jgi:site-specific DNA-cytosine methylase